MTKTPITGTEVRAWFTAAGTREVAFDGHPEAYEVGVNQVVADVGTMPHGRLFTFQPG